MVLLRHAGQHRGQHRGSGGHVLHGLGGEGILHEFLLGGPGIDKQCRFHLLVHDLRIQEHPSVIDPRVLRRYVFQFVYIISRSVNVQLRVFQVGLPEALHQVL